MPNRWPHLARNRVFSCTQFYASCVVLLPPSKTEIHLAGHMGTHAAKGSLNSTSWRKAYSDDVMCKLLPEYGGCLQRQNLKAHWNDAMSFVRGADDRDNG